MPAFSSEPRSGNRTIGNESRYFVPQDRGSLLDPSWSGPLHSCRPVRFLTGLGCLGSPAPSGTVRSPLARDHALLESLLTVIRQKEPSLTSEMASVPTSALLRLMGPSGRRRELHATLDRLASSRWAFASGTTAPIYRHVLASLPSPRGGPEAHVLDVGWDEIAAIAGHRPQLTGGRRGHVAAAVVESFARDLRERLDPSELTVTVQHRRRAAEDEAPGTETGPLLDRVSITVKRPLAPIERLKTRRLAVKDQKTKKMIPLPMEHRWALDRPDCRAYKVSLRAWARCSWVVDVSLDRLAELSTAFDYALDEAINRADPRYGYLTAGAATRPYCREHLLEAIRTIGPDRAMLLFCCGEQADPDLSRPEVHSALVHDGTRLFVKLDRMSRRAAEKLSGRRRAKAAAGKPVRGPIDVLPERCERRPPAIRGGALSHHRGG